MCLNVLQKNSINCPFDLEINMFFGRKVFLSVNVRIKILEKMCNEFLIDCTITGEANETWHKGKFMRIFEQFVIGCENLTLYGIDMVLPDKHFL